MTASTPSTNTPPSSLVMNGNGQPVIMNGGSNIDSSSRTTISNGTVSNGRISNGTAAGTLEKSHAPSAHAHAAHPASLKKRPADFFTLLLKAVFVFFLHIFVVLYTYLTLPIYWFLQKPWERLQQTNFVRAEQTNKDDPSSPWVGKFPNKYPYVLDHVNTIDEMMNKVGDYFNLDRRALGYRRVLREHTVYGPDGTTPLRIDGRPVKKRELSDYHWISYLEMIKRKNFIARGFHLNGIDRHDRVVVLCETCPEYLMVELAIANAGAVQVNVFSTLGDDGIAHAVRETGSRFIFTSFELLSKARSIIEKNNLDIDKVIYIPRRVEEVTDEEQKECDKLVTNMGDIQFVSLVDVEQDGEERGHEVEDRCKPLDKDEIAFISKFVSLFNGSRDIDLCFLHSLCSVHFRNNWSAQRCASHFVSVCATVARYFACVGTYYGNC